MMRFLLLFAIAVSGVRAQTDVRQAFEVVSIKRSAPPVAGTLPHVGCRGGPETRDPSIWICENATVWMLAQIGFDLRRFQVILPDRAGGPFDITARIRPGATKGQLRLMIQDLLVDRFHLAYHWESKETGFYEMVVAKSGPKFREETDPAASATSDGSSREIPVPKIKIGEDGYPEVPPEFNGGVLRGSRGRLQIPHGTLEDFAALLATRLDQPVIDATGLLGTYRITVYWDVDEVPGSRTPGVTSSEIPSAEAVRGPSLESAIREQLGLQLISKKGSLKMLMIDHVDSSPTEN